MLPDSHQAEYIEQIAREKADILMMQQAFRALFNKEEGTLSERIEKVESNEVWMSNPYVKAQIEFVKNPSKNNILQPD